MGISVPLAVVLTFKADNLDFEPSIIFYCIAFLAGFILGLVLFIISERIGSFDNWNTWSTIAHNNKLSIFIFIFTIFPLILKIAKLVDLEKYLTPLFYAYWVCGLFLLVFIVLFKLIAPQVYKYKNFEKFKLDANSIVALREEAFIALKSIDARKDNKKTHEAERVFIGQDIIILRKIVNGEQVKLEDAFAILRNRLAYHNSVGRVFLVLSLFFPAYILPLLFTGNILLVFNQAYDVFTDGTSILKMLAGW